MREKWDEVHYAGGSTYGEKTIERAITNVSDHYDPDAEGSATLTETPGTARSEQTRAYLVEKNRVKMNSSLE